MRLRGYVFVPALLLLAAACSSGGSNGGGGGGGDLGDATTTSAPAENAACKTTTLRGTEIGVTPKTITVTVMADVNNSIRPGLFRGSWDGMNAWAKYINSKGGLACRTVVVKEGDSKLSPTDAANGAAAACADSVAMVGTSALFLQDVSAMEKCKDKAGTVSGIPDIALVQTESAQQCSPISFATLGLAASCPYKGTGPRTFQVGYTSPDYYFKQYGATALHGVYVIPKDLPSTIAATMPAIRANNKMGIPSDAEFGVSGAAIQTDYTQLVQAMKSDKSTFVRNGLDYKGTVLMRKEAAVQGVNTVKVWDCTLQCYDKRLIGEGGSAVEDQYVWLNILPFEDKGSNPELDSFLKYTGTPSGFSAQAWIAGEIFARAVDDTVKAHGGDPNSITRANLLTAIRGMHDFDANGMVPKIDIGRKIGSSCVVGMRVKDGKFVRIDPAAPGTFDCNNDKKAMTLTLDPAAEYHG
jgi:hypothetical protein